MKIAAWPKGFIAITNQWMQNPLWKVAKPLGGILEASHYLANWGRGKNKEEQNFHINLLKQWRGWKTSGDQTELIVPGKRKTEHIWVTSVEEEKECRKASFVTECRLHQNTHIRGACAVATCRNCASCVRQSLLKTLNGYRSVSLHPRW